MSRWRKAICSTRRPRRLLLADLLGAPIADYFVFCLYAPIPAVIVGVKLGAEIGTVIPYLHDIPNAVLNQNYIHYCFFPHPPLAD